jgi:hypothetical protein
MAILLLDIIVKQGRGVLMDSKNIIHKKLSVLIIN